MKSYNNTQPLSLLYPLSWIDFGGAPIEIFVFIFVILTAFGNSIVKLSSNVESLPIHLLLKSPSKALLAVYVSVYALADILIPSSETYSVPATTSVQTLGIISPFFNTG